ncbi:sulfate adenylyltransferase subunit CysN [Bradyrhizobium sp. SZCCHNRI20481]|uniref:sulfate adenylyltransferase subunit CysN n=1 Tax=Bradyrhizobium sp. SZCCHNRI20481 TaxID=3057286 RepID=UPI0029160BEE|nr:sulfate adenylyltransferase subunit CysN [Bradyrhizobium sp. SZCCHNRI20481]
MHAPDNASSSAGQTLGRTDSRPALRFLTCGSVDDGKSTLIGRLLYEQNLILDDDFASLKSESRKFGAVGSDIDFALLLDGLEAEREQGITIDVAYCYFATPTRAFVVADTPGHEQYTRNMATGASNCELAVLLVDARKGLRTQTRRHAIIASLLGIRHIVLAVNKIDLVDYSQVVFEAITAEFAGFASELGFKEFIAIPISARYGDNVSSVSGNTSWYNGPHLLRYLETVEVENDSRQYPFRLAVQWVNRPDLDFRGYAGTVCSGRVRVGDELVVLPAGHVSQVKSIISSAGAVAEAEAGDAITIVLEDEIDIARGDMLVAPRDLPPVADQLSAHVVWMSPMPLLPGHSYLMKINKKTLLATVTEVKHRIDLDGAGEVNANILELNEIGACDFSIARPVPFDAYVDNPSTGAFILIDHTTNETVAAGMVDLALGRTTNIHRRPITISKVERSRLMNHKAAVMWFTGLSGAGKSTIANLVEADLHARGIHTIMLDGDHVRYGLNKDLSFTPADRVENMRRVGEVAKLMTEAGLVVLCAFISPFRAERQMVRELIAEGEFIEIFVDTPIEVCAARDPKGLYRRAYPGEIKDFTGVDQRYEAPERPELHLLAAQDNARTLADRVVEQLVRRNIF